MPRQKNFACNLKRDFKSQAPTRAEYINGQRPFFFCASSLSEVLPLANCLGQEQPIYLMESALVVFSDKPTENNIKALAAHHVRDILAIQPEGDYILGG